MRISKILEETSDSKTAFELLLSFSHIIEEYYMKSHIDKDFLFLIGNWMLRLSKSLKDLFIPAMEILRHALSLRNRSNLDNIIHHRIEKKLAKNAAKFVMLSKDKD